ncbi:hypothetical protein ACHAQA_009299 [Verticillium albo-atrum]
MPPIETPRFDLTVDDPPHLEDLLNMEDRHGIMPNDGESLDGVAYSDGDPVTIFDDGRNDNNVTQLHVLNRESNRAMLVSVNTVCWIPTHVDERPTGTIIFTIYGGRVPMQRPGGSTSSFGRRAVQVLSGSCNTVEHTVVAENDASTRVLERAGRRSHSLHQWDSHKEDWPTQDVENLLCYLTGQTMYTLGPEVFVDPKDMRPPTPPPTVPPTPEVSIELLNPNPTVLARVSEAFRRDSGVDVRSDSDSKTSPEAAPFSEHNLFGTVGTNTDLHINYMTLPSPTSSDQPELHRQPQRNEPVGHAPAGRNDATWTQQAATGNTDWSPYNTTHDYHAPQQSVRTATPGPAHQQAIPRGHTRMPLPALSEDGQYVTPGYYEPVQAHRFDNGPPHNNAYAAYGMANNAGQDFHRPQERQLVDLTVPTQPPGYDLHRLQDRPAEGLNAPTQPVGYGFHRPQERQNVDITTSTQPAGHAFHRSQEGQNVDMTASTQPTNYSFQRSHRRQAMDMNASTDAGGPGPATAASRGTQQASRPANGRTPLPSTVPPCFSRSPNSDSTAPAFRPELIVDFFDRQTRPYIRDLEAREREQQQAVLAPDQTAPLSVTEPLGLIRNATAETLRLLRALRPGSMPSFHLTEQRLRGEVEKIIASVQSMVQLALANSGIPQQDQRLLGQQVQSLAGYISYLGEVFSDMVQQANAPAAGTQTQPGSSSSLQQVNTGVPQSHPANTSNHVNPANGMAMNGEHQTMMHQLAEGVVPPPPTPHGRMMGGHIPPMPSPPQGAQMMPTHGMMPAGPAQVTFHQPGWGVPSVPNVVDPSMPTAYPNMQSGSGHSSPYMGPSADPNPRAHYLSPGSADMGPTTSAPGMMLTAPAPAPTRTRLPLVLSPMPMPVAPFDRRSSLNGRRVSQPQRERERERYRANPYSRSPPGLNDRRGST